jgi:peptide/nickel transport system substrate-binding protein
VLRTSDVAFPGAVDAAALFQQSAAKAGIPLEIKREPDDGYWSERLEQATLLRQLLGRASGAGPDVFHRLSVHRRLERHQVLQPGRSTRCSWRHAPNWMSPSARRMYAEMARIVHDEGGLICPMFNDFIDARAATRSPGSGRPERRDDGRLGFGFQVLAELTDGASRS